MRILLVMTTIMVITLPCVFSGGVSVSRHFKGDIFSQEDCPTSYCSGPGLSRSPLPLTGGRCTCQCATAWPTFREDIGSCVSSLNECELAEFASGGSTERIPFVYLPLSGQLVYPSAHILLPAASLTSPICVVSTVDLLTTQGWRDISNFTRDLQQPFQLYRESEQTYLQWMGTAATQRALEGRLLLVNLLCKDTGGTDTDLFSPCIAFRTAGSPGAPPEPPVTASPGHGHSLTERDYLAIGVCAGFLVVLYIFAMIVFIMIKLKQRRDKRLREEFLRLPAPPGIGYKSSRILGLEESYLQDMARLATEARRSSRAVRRMGAAASMGAGCELHHGGGTRDSGGGVGQRHTNANESGGRVLEVNEALLEAHRKVVESRLQLEVARTVGEESLGCCAENCPGEGGLRQQGSKRRFFPNLEEIPEESRCSTIMKERKEEEGEEGSESCGSGSGLGSLENREDSGGTGKSNHQVSLDSGIVTRSASPTPEQRSDTSSHSSSQGIYSDDETVDVAGSEEEETDSEREPSAEAPDPPMELELPARRCSTEPGRGKVKNNLDFLSEIYNTAFSKLPKVQSGDESEDRESQIYSSTSARDMSSVASTSIRDSWDPSMSSKDTWDPKMSSKDTWDPKISSRDTWDHSKNSRDSWELSTSARDSLEPRTSVYRNPLQEASGVSGVYISGEPGFAEILPGEVRRSFKFSAGEKMTIAISRDRADHVFSDKLLIPVAGDPGLSRGKAGDGGPGSLLTKVEDFDPDTLERGTDRRDARMTDATEGEENEEADKPQMEEETTQKVHLGTPAAGEYSFRLFPVGDSQEKRAPFPLPAPFDKRLPGDRRSFALMQNAGETPGQNSGELLGQKSEQTNNKNLPSTAPALPPKKGRTNVVTMQ